MSDLEVESPQFKSNSKARFRLRNLALDTENANRLHEVLHALPTAVYTTDAAGRITFYNEAAAAFWGCRPPLDSAQWCGSWRMVSPHGTAVPHDQCPIALSLWEWRAINGMGGVAKRADGAR